MSQVLTTAVIFLATALLALLGFVGTAFAADDTDLEMKMKQLSAEQIRGRLVIDYKISKKSWKAARRAGITPRLNLYTGNSDNFRYSVILSGRSGKLELPKELRLKRHDRVQVGLVGFNGFHHIARTSLGERCAETVSIPIHRKRVRPRPRPHQGHPHADRGPAKIINACSQAVTSHEVDNCIKLGSALPRKEAPSVIKACGEQTQWDSEFRSCMKIAQKIKHDNPAQTVNACGTATKWNSEFNSCLKQSRQFGYSPVRNIEACDAQTRWNSEFTKCFSESKPFGRHAARVIRACGDATSWNSDFNQCMQSAATRRRG